jgi:hypothetical protein
VPLPAGELPLDAAAAPFIFLALKAVPIAFDTLRTSEVDLLPTGDPPPPAAFTFAISGRFL